MKISVLLLLLWFAAGFSYAQNIPEPESFFGFKPCTDRMLFTYEKLIDYVKAVDNASDRLLLKEIGATPMGKPMYVAFISSPENLKNLERLRQINKELALNDKLTDVEVSALVNEGKVFVLTTLSMHSSEVTPSQAAPLYIYDWVTTNDPKKLAVLNDVVFMLNPNHNPDGMDMVVDYYNKTKNTKYEGTNFPGVYHKYIGHDNNRDFVTLTQTDTKAISAITSTDWFPQVHLEKHQMGLTGPRYYVPPSSDPIAENVEGELFSWIGIFGNNMQNDLTGSGLTGVSQHAMFDEYWPGASTTAMWKNTIGLLTEGASAQLAKPVYVEPTELQGGEKGLAEYKKSVNFVSPWPGGWWSINELSKYEIASMNSVLNTAHIYKDRILKFRNDQAKLQVKKGQSQAPYYFIVSQKQHDPSELVQLVNLMKEHGIYVYKLDKPVSIENSVYSAGDIVLPLAQPFRSFVKEVMEAQKYPERHFTPDGELIEPYDITSWSLPLHKGLTSVQIDTRIPELEANISKIENNYTLATPVEQQAYVILSSASNESYKLIFNAIQAGATAERFENDIELNDAKIPAGSFILENKGKLAELLKTTTAPVIYSASAPESKKVKVSVPRIALVESNFGDMDAGWTRFILDTYGIKFTVIHPSEFEKADLNGKYDAVIFPDRAASILKEGKMKGEGQYYASPLPPELTKGMGTKGMENLLRFFDNGGNIISWCASTDLFAGPLSYKNTAAKGKDTATASNDFQLPFRNVTDALKKKGLAVEGSLVKMNIIQNQLITWGTQSTLGIFYRGNPVFTTSVPNLDMDRRVLGYFDEGHLLLSGYMKGDEYLANKSGLIWLKKGKGQMVLFAFSPIFRASVPSNYKLLFNSILLPKAE